MNGENKSKPPSIDQDFRINDLNYTKWVFLITWDGRSIIFWWLAIQMISIAENRFMLDQIKYPFFAILEFAFFVQFRVSSHKDEMATNI